MSAINLEPVLEAKANEDLPIAVAPGQVEPPAELEVQISVAQLEKEIALLHDADRIYKEEPADQLSHGNLPVVVEAAPPLEAPEVQEHQEHNVSVSKHNLSHQKRKVPPRRPQQATDMYRVHLDVSAEDPYRKSIEASGHALWEMVAPPVIKPSASSLAPHRHTVQKTV